MMHIGSDRIIVKNVSEFLKKVIIILYFIAATKKKKANARDEDLQQYDDTLLFAPRETFANVTTSRRRNPSASSTVSSLIEEPQKIPRCQDHDYPLKINEQFTFRHDDQLGLTIPGYAVSPFF